MARRAETGFSPALIGSVALHGLVAAAILIGLPWKKPVPITLGESVPVTIVTTGPTNVRPAEEALEDQTALTETPAPEATPEPPAPAPAPTPAPKPSPTASKTPKPAKPKDDFFASMEASLSKTKASTAKSAAPAPKGPSRAETSVSARPALGAATGLSAAALGRLQGEVQDRWNPNCEVEGGANVSVRVVFVIGPGGRVVGQPETPGTSSSDPVVKAASDRAVRALLQASPFAYLPSDLYGQKIALNFNAKQACSR
ncbi:energy transducer TonB [Caulobacter henricii]|uniref:Cell envelope biogenesis protein TolA n=1 Tax=Caulobacter henricii TaxID=69395 RepID=A0A0P0P401_9CAUL|nr:energy transducer TonB [Caulobacter henricii]ALL15365.1 cell envelope biogenesis protein TolA [Caulobacter henricii]